MKEKLTIVKVGGAVVEDELRVKTGADAIFDGVFDNRLQSQRRKLENGNRRIKLNV